jgi:hypothetical protein
MSNADEKRVKLIAERKGFHLEKAGHGKGHGRFYIMNPPGSGSGQRLHPCATPPSPRTLPAFERTRTLPPACDHSPTT